MRLLQSQLHSPGPLVVARVSDRMGYAPEQRAAQAPVMWPRYIPGVGTRLVPINPQAIPAGWSSVGAHVPSRPVTCEQIDCPCYLRGWTEILRPDGEPATYKAGRMDPDEAAQITGYFGAASIPPQVIHHPPGTDCPEIHKQADHRIPPLYSVNGKPVLWNQWEDSLGGGLYRAQQLQREGRY